jgi:uncharacterized membrane protein YeaQ/YmgE (transglycosylase-associated protein family)
MGIIWTIVIGFVAGVIAKFIMPGSNEPSGFVLTTIHGGPAWISTEPGGSQGTTGAAHPRRAVAQVSIHPALVRGVAVLQCCSVDRGTRPPPPTARTKSVTCCRLASFACLRAQNTFAFLMNSS